ncbi:hypothetical protein MKX03_031234 [Papaver bracteatum]|nr:hypothetical protein MKX03_031234 [Papaver bracteatum]
MENNTSTMISRGKKTFMINELLTQAKEEVKQLEMHLAPSAITCGKLSITKIVSALEISLVMLNKIKSEDRGDQPQMMTGLTPITQTESPLRSVSRSPRRDYESDLMVNYFKKRKILPRWTEKVRVCELTGFEGPPDDGYSWRKYGKKDILNTNYPRAYYRCAHRDVQGCFAKKLVQRTDEDPSLFSVTYCGKHTCIQAWHLVPWKQHKKYDPKQNGSKEALINFETSCHVRAEDLATRVVPSFSLPVTSKPVSCLEKENDSNNNIFSSLTPDNHFSGSLLSPPLVSAEVYDPYYLPTYGHTVQTSDYDVNELISSAALDVCPPFQDLDSDIPIQSGFSYLFDTPGFFD